MDRAVTELGTFLGAIIGLAVISVIFSKNAATGPVITSAGNALANVIRAAVSPVSGGGGVSVPSIPQIGSN